MTEKEGFDCIRSARNLTGHLQRLKIQQREQTDRFLEDSHIKRRLEVFAMEYISRKTELGKSRVKREAYKYIRESVESEKARRAYRSYLNGSVTTFSMAREGRIQVSNPYGVNSFFTRRT